MRNDTRDTRDTRDARDTSDDDKSDLHVRLDKWLWVARFFKTRALAADDIARGRVSVNGQVAKASRELKPGDLLAWRSNGVLREVQVLGLSRLRGPAPVAQALYAETPASVAARENAADQRRRGTEPALAIEQGRPTKRDRRVLADWQRWSASADTLPDADAHGNASPGGRGPTPGAGSRRP